MLYLSYALFISSELFPFVFLGSLRGRVWVEDFDIEVCSFEAPSPEAVCCNVESGPVLFDS